MELYYFHTKDNFDCLSYDFASDTFELESKSFFNAKANLFTMNEINNFPDEIKERIVKGELIREKCEDNEFAYIVSKSPSSGLVFYEPDGTTISPKLYHRLERFPSKYVNDKMKVVSYTDMIPNPPTLTDDKANEGIEPNHYKTDGGIQPIDVIKSIGDDNYEAFCQGNVIKYVMRYKEKNGLEDLKKARTYLNWLIEANE